MTEQNKKMTNQSNIITESIKKMTEHSIEKAEHNVEKVKKIKKFAGNVNKKGISIVLKKLCTFLTASGYNISVKGRVGSGEGEFNQ